jgi:hypothetical protein
MKNIDQVNMDNQLPEVLIQPVQPFVKKWNDITMRKVVVNLLKKRPRERLWLEENENGVDRFYSQAGCTEKISNRKAEFCKHCQIMVSYQNNIYQFKPI